MRHLVIGLVVLAVVFGCGKKPPSVAEQPPPPQPLPDDVNKAWKDAGATTG